MQRTSCGGLAGGGVRVLENLYDLYVIYIWMYVCTVLVVLLVSPRSDLLSWVGDHLKKVSHFWAT